VNLEFRDGGSGFMLKANGPMQFGGQVYSSNQGSEFLGSVDPGGVTVTRIAPVGPCLFETGPGFRFGWNEAGSAILAGRSGCREVTIGGMTYDLGSTNPGAVLFTTGSSSGVPSFVVTGSGPDLFDRHVLWHPPRGYAVVSSSAGLVDFNGKAVRATAALVELRIQR
jgi:hypothetical protein